MAIRAGRVTRDVLLDAVLPTATKTYTVISHGFVINTAKQMLHDKGFNVVDEKYTALDGAQVACGAFHINYGDDPELGMLFAFANSYDKSLKFSCAIGAYVKTNETSILSKDGSGWVRMHTGNADQEAADTIEKLVDNAEAYFQQLQADKEIMKQIKLTRREYGELLGRLFVDLRILGMEQLSAIKKEFEKPSYKYASDPDSLWALYNHILIGISKANPKTWMEQQKIIHFHLMDEFELTTFDEEEVIENPNQMDLEVQEEELEAAGVSNASEMNDNTEEESVIMDSDTEDEATENDVVELTEDELSEQLHGVNNNEEEITGTENSTSTVPEIVPRDLDAEEDADAEMYLKPIEFTEATTGDEEEPVVAETMSMTVEVAVEKFGHMLTEEELAGVQNGNLDKGTLDKLKTLAVQYDIVTEQIDEIINEEYVKSATDGETQLPKEEITLPPMPGKTPEAEIETPKVEDVVEDVSEESEVDAGEEFFMTRQDLDEMYEGVELEVGFLVTIGEDDCEITSIADDSYGLVLVAEPVAEEEEEDIPTMPEPVANMDFSIGDAEEIAPAETMLRTEPVVDEEQVKIDEALEVMNSKVELTAEEKAAQAAISMELEELYGVAPEFTYKLSDGQYQVTLDSGEVVVLTESYIKSLEV